MTIRSATHTEVVCDVCEYVMCKQMTEQEAFEAVTGDGGWRQFSTRLVCEGCIEERACQIFGHRVTISDEGYRYCERCWEGVR